MISTRVAKKNRAFWFGLSLALAILTSGLTFGAEARAASAEPRVARVAVVEGEVSYLNADAERWTPVDVNAPLASGDRFYAGPGGRAEIQLAGGFYARISSDSEIDLLELSSDAVQVRVALGTAIFRLSAPPSERYVEIATPGAAIAPRARGIYRVDVDAEGHTTVSVREGEADAFQGDQRFRLASGRGAEFAIAGEGDDSGEPLRVFDASEIAHDPLDDWDTSREARVASSASYQYVSRDVYGAEDLDQYGDWQQTPDYGPVWRPTHVEAGWAPFTQGRWVWQDPWGWTWVDYAPWGWAPSHYGRWVYANDYWGWAPGPVVTRPVYTPAVVGFLGFNISTPNVSVSVGLGGPSVGWVPLGYGEPVVPWWGGFGGAVVGRPSWGGWGGPRIVNNKVINNNITNITNINYVNMDRPRGFTAVTRDDFVSGNLRRIDVPKERLREARPFRGNPGIVPTRDSLIAARPEQVREARAIAPPQAAIDRAAVTKRKPVEDRPQFARKMDLIEKSKGAPVAPAELQRLARTAPAAAARTKTVQARGSKVIVPQVNEKAPSLARGEAGRRQAPANLAESTNPEARAERGRSAPAANGAEERQPGGRDAIGRGQAGQAEPRDQARAQQGQPQQEREKAQREQRESVARSQQQQDETASKRGEQATREQQEQATQREQRESVARSRQQQDEAATQRREQALRERQEQGTQREQRESAARSRPQQDDAATQRREQAAREQQERQEAQRAQKSQRESVARSRQQQEEASQRRAQAAREQQDRQEAQRQERESVTRARQQQEEASQRRDAAAREQQVRQQERQEMQRRQRDAEAQANQQRRAVQQQQRAEQQQRAQQQQQAQQKQRAEQQQRVQQQQREQQQAAEQRSQAAANQKQAKRNQRRAPGRDATDRDGG